MFRIETVVKFDSGYPQFRITETFDDIAPTYIYYSQQEMEEDLSDIQINQGEKKQIKTHDKIMTTKEGDIIFSLISGRATIVRKVHEGYLLTQNYVKLTPNSEIVPSFLIYILNEDTDIKKQLQIGLQGSNTLKYTLNQIKDLQINKLPGKEKQKLIGDIYLSSLKLEALKKRKASLETKITFQKLKNSIKNK